MAASCATPSSAGVSPPASPPPPPPSVSAPILRLPPDAFALIIAFVPFWPRLRVLSFVCKAWRAAALRSVTSLVIHRSGMPHAQRLIDLFPSLCSLALQAPANGPPSAPLSLPQRLTHLSLATPHNLLLPPALSSLGISSDKLAVCVPLACHTATCLTALSLDLYSASLTADDSFSEVRWPALCDLTLALPAALPASYTAWLAAHAPQLTSLRLRALFDTALESTLTLAFPRLTLLNLKWDFLRPLLLPDLSARMPRLQSLGIDSPSFPRLPPASLTALTSLQVGCVLTVAEQETLVHLSRLRSLSLDVVDASHCIPSLRTRLTAIHRVGLSVSSDFWAKLAEFRSLRELSDLYPDDRPRADAPPSPLQIQRLLLCPTPSADAIRRYVRHFPSAQLVRIDARIIREADMRALVREHPWVHIARMEEDGRRPQYHVSY